MRRQPVRVRGPHVLERAGPGAAGVPAAARRVRQQAPAPPLKRPLTACLPAMFLAGSGPYSHRTFSLSAPSPPQPGQVRGPHGLPRRHPGAPAATRQNVELCPHGIKKGRLPHGVEGIPAAVGPPPCRCRIRHCCRRRRGPQFCGLRLSADFVPLVNATTRRPVALCNATCQVRPVPVPATGTPLRRPR